MQFTSPSGDCCVKSQGHCELEFFGMRSNSKRLLLLDMLARLYDAFFIRDDLNLSQMLKSVLLMMLSLPRSIFLICPEKG